MGRGCIYLALSWCAAYGFVELTPDKRSWRLTAGMDALPRFLAAERSALVALGLEREARPVMTLDQFVAETLARKAQQTALVGAGKVPVAEVEVETARAGEGAQETGRS